MAAGSDRDVGDSVDGQAIRAADLAEDIADAVSEADRDWDEIELRVRDLLELIARRAR